jgi:3-hydroxybutyryl-CoA dehydrogenase
MAIKTLTVVSAGTLGSQIALMAALHGVKVKIWNGHTDRAHKRLQTYLPMFKQGMGLTDEQVAAGKANIEGVTNDWSVPFKDTDLVIEATAEKVDVKKDVLEKISEQVPADTPIASNSSTMLPSQLSKLVSHPERFLHIHFANHIWQLNTAEIVGSDKTKPEYLAEAKAFAEQIGMLPIMLKKENPGYIMNALLIPMLQSALWVWANGVADPETIDRDWINSSGMPMGPFMVLDMVGLRTSYNIAAARAESDPASKIIAAKLKEMLDEGRTGEAAGQGFYSYPHPAFEDPDFMKKG